MLMRAWFYAYKHEIKNWLQNLFRGRKCKYILLSMGQLGGRRDSVYNQFYGTKFGKSFKLRYWMISAIVAIAPLREIGYSLNGQILSSRDFLRIAATLSAPPL